VNYYRLQVLVLPSGPVSAALKGSDWKGHCTQDVFFLESFQKPIGSQTLEHSKTRIANLLGSCDQGPASPANANTPTKKDPNAPLPTPLEKLLSEYPGPIRQDGSDKFFGFENVRQCAAVYILFQLLTIT
jgi:hypothetical protein